MKTKNLQLFLICEVVNIFLVTVCFRLIPDRLTASLIASTFFIGLGVMILVMSIRSEHFLKSLVFWVVQLHLFFASIPLLASRLAHMDTGFEQIEIFGLPGPKFHMLATGLYFMLILATAVDLWRAKKGYL